MRLVSNAPLWLCLFAYLIIGQLALPGVVLCIGVAGDHVAFETTANGLSCDSIFDTKSNDASFLSETSGGFVKAHCGPCVDIEGSVGNSSINTASTHDTGYNVTNPVFWASLFPPLPVFTEISGRRFFSTLPLPTSSFVSFQTSTLLC